MTSNKLLLIFICNGIRLLMKYHLLICLIKFQIRKVPGKFQSRRSINKQMFPPTKTNTMSYYLPFTCRIEAKNNRPSFSLFPKHEKLVLLPVACIRKTRECLSQLKKRSSYSPQNVGLHF